MADRKQELACGCLLALDYDKNMMIVYCSKHKSAPDLYEALKGLVDAYIINPGTEHEFVSLMEIGVPPKWEVARKALAKAGGK